jgi:quinol-cytochrome oxidoreductase complex cytochrome b subunit
MTESEIPKEEQTIPFFPDHVATEARVALVTLLVVVIIGVAALLNPLGLGEPADPLNTPAHTKPEWYFLFLFQLLKYLPKTTGALLPFAAIFVLLLWPFLDRKDDSLRARRNRLILTAVVMVAILVLTALGEIT